MLTLTMFSVNSLLTLNIAVSFLNTKRTIYVTTKYIALFLFAIFSILIIYYHAMNTRNKFEFTSVIFVSLLNDKINVR